MKSVIKLTTVGKLFAYERFSDHKESNPVILSEDNEVYGGLMLRPLPAPVAVDYTPSFGSASYIDGLLHGKPVSPMIVRKVGNPTDYILLSSETKLLIILRFLNNAFSVVVDGKPTKWKDLDAKLSDSLLQVQIPIYEVEGDDMELYEFMNDHSIVPTRYSSYTNLRNAVFYGNLLKELHAWFNSKNDRSEIWDHFVSVNSGEGRNYVYVALSFIAGSNIADYLCEHKEDSAVTVIKYFDDVTSWVTSLFGFPKNAYNVDWGPLYNKYHNNKYDGDTTRKRCEELMSNNFIENKWGIYEYILSGEKDEKLLMFDI